MSRDWVAKIYSFAVQPDITFYFKVPLEVSLNRILEGRPTLKYHEAGLDMGWSADPYESFRIFQGKILKEYAELGDEAGFTVIDATKEIHAQQSEGAQDHLEENRSADVPGALAQMKEKKFFERQLPELKNAKFAGKLFVIEGDGRLGGAPRRSRA